MKTEVVPQRTIAEVVKKRDIALDLYKDAYAAAVLAQKAIEAAQQASKAAAPTAETFFNHSIGEEIKRFNATVAVPDPEVYFRVAKRIIDTNVWSYIIELTELELLMDKQSREELRTQLMTPPPKPTEDGEVVRDEDVDWMPEVSVENIAATIQGFMAQSETLFQRGIANVFSKLDRRFRSHDGFKIGSRIIIDRVYDDDGYYSHRRDHESTIYDIERTFLLLDNRKPTAKYASLVRQVRNEREQYKKENRIPWGGLFQSEHEGEFFKIRIFKNGNAHLWFTRKDLVQKVNKVLGDYYGEVVGDGQTKEADPFDNIKNTPAKHFGFYPTPDSLAQRLIDDYAFIRNNNGVKILEPNAGTGNISSLAAKTEGTIVDVVEIQPELIAGLKNAGIYHNVWHRDFLKLSPDETGLYDRVLMNPPFDRERDIDHVMHAWKFLKPGGILVAIMSAGTEFRETKKSAAFRKFAAKHSTYNWQNKWCHQLPDGSFASVGTNVNTIIVQLEKPETDNGA